MTDLEKRKQKVIDYKQTFGSEHGKRVLEDLQRCSFFHSSTFKPGDPHETAFREGSRNVVLRIMTILSIDPNTLTEVKNDDIGR